VGSSNQYKILSSGLVRKNIKYNMGMTIQGVYDRMEIPLNLREHMMRVGGVVEIMAEKWRGPTLDRKTAVVAALCHDLANIVKFDFSKPEMMGEEAKRVDYWRGVQQRVIEKYGSDIHQATLAMGLGGIWSGGW
jgi:5'-deoxynucleotidase YfbR-like HD superfamily hydrolase